MTIKYKDEFGYQPIAIEKADEIHAYDIQLNGVYTLPAEECIEVFIQPESQIKFGSAELQNIVINANSIVVLDVSNTNIITLSGNTTVHVVVLK